MEKIEHPGLVQKKKKCPVAEGRLISVSSSGGK